MITSQITGRPIFGSDPSGYTPLTPNPVKYVITQSKRVEFDYTDLTFGVNIPATKDNFLTMVKTKLDNDYSALVFTDPAANYDIRYEVVDVRLDFEVAGTDRSIWSERTWKWYVDVVIKVNVN
jgi:hypothetical protein